LALALEGGAKNVAKRGARIGRPVLGDCLFLLGHLERLDRHRYLMGAAVELRDASIDLLASREPLGTLLRSIARQFRPLHEGGELGTNDLHVDAGFLHFGDLASDNSTLLEIAGLCERITLQLLDAERDALLLDINVEHLGLDLVALLVLLDDLLAGTFPVEI